MSETPSDLSTDSRIYDANKGKRVPLLSALEYMSERWIDANSCQQTTIDLVQACKSLLTREWFSWEHVASHPDTDIWLWWNCEQTFPVNLMRDGGGRMFAPSGQWGWSRAQFLDEMGGLWSPLICPDPPKHLREKFPPPETGE